MSGQGKYTQYAPAANAKNTLLNKLFKGNDTIANPMADLVGKEVDARQQVLARAKEFLTPATTAGDPGMFPNGVALDFTGDQNGTTSPNIDDVKWKNPGDPANGYMPDPTSPGPGSTDPHDKNKDPQISVADVKGAGYVPGAPGTGTKSPSKTSVEVVKEADLGTAGKLAYDVNGFG